MKLKITESLRLVEGKNIFIGGNEKISESVKIPKIPQNIAQLLEDKNTALVKFIEAGWSYNGNYYSEKVLEQVPSLVLEQAHFQFLDHLEDGEDLSDRSVMDLVSYAREAWYDSETKAVYGVVYFPESKSDTYWLYEMIQKEPELVGLSISAYVEAHEEEIKEGKGNVVDNWVFFESVDYVLFASAGGSGVLAKESINKKITESKKRPLPNKDSLIKEAKLLHEQLSNTVKQYVDKYIHIEYFYLVLDALYDVFWGILYTDEVAEEDRSAELKKAFDEAYSILSKLNFVNGNQTKESITMIKTLEQLKAEYPELVSMAVTEAIEKANITSLKESNQNLKSENDELVTSVAKKTEEVDELKQKVAELTKAVEGYEANEKKKAHTELVEKLLAESKLPEEVITSRFKETLLSMENEDEIKEEIKDRLELVNKVVGKNTSTVHEGTGKQNFNDDEDEDSEEALKRASENLINSL